MVAVVGDFPRRPPELISYQSRSFFEEGITMSTSHVDLYDKPKYVNAAVEKLIDFFNEKPGT